MGDRWTADYDHDMMGTWTEADAYAAISQARTFVDEVADWFTRHHETDRTALR